MNKLTQNRQIFHGSFVYLFIYLFIYNERIDLFYADRNLSKNYYRWLVHV